MTDNELHTVELRDDYYRDSMRKVAMIIASLCVAMLLLGITSFYLYMNKPKPVTFAVGQEWRIVPDVGVDQPYLSTPEVTQWVTNALRSIFVFDFVHYNEQVQASTRYFTNDGWKVFLNQLNIYANYNKVQSDKLFINGIPSGAPIILNQGVLSGRYAWWVEMPIELHYLGNTKPSVALLKLQVLVVRVSTLNNLMGVGIDNIVVANGSENQPGNIG
jgi:intracellular multiplication protein IcmL